MTTYMKAGTNLLLTNFALGVVTDNADFIAKQMFTDVETPDLKGNYKAKQNKSKRYVDTRHKPGSPPVRISNDFEEKEYECVKHSAAIDINEDDQIRAKAAGTDVGEEATEDLMEGMMISREKDMIDLLTNVTGHTSAGHYKALSSTEQWSKSTANIFANILEAKKAVGQGCGGRATSLFLRDDIADVLFNSLEFRERMDQLKISDPSLNALLTMLNKEKAGIDNIIITPAYYDKSAPKDGETIADSDFDFIAPPSVVIARVEPTGTITKKINTAFAYFYPTGYQQLLIRNTVDENLDCETYKGSWYYGMTANYKASYCFGNVI